MWQMLSVSKEAFSLLLISKMAAVRKFVLEHEHVSLFELLVCILGFMNTMIKYLELVVAISYKTLFSCLVELPGNKNP